MRRIGFVLNPIAGMGGRVGLKGTDDVVDRAIELGAEPRAQLRALETLRHLKNLLDDGSGDVTIHWLTCSAAMGADCLREAGFEDFEVVHEAGAHTTENDTKAAVRRFQGREVDLILFCGGDGTARDVCSVTGTAIPVLGIPSGVKMYSGVFGTNPTRTADILAGYLEGRLALNRVDVVDLDEHKFRRGEWAVRLYQSALTPYEPTLTQSAKMLIEASTDAEVKEDIAASVLEEIGAQPETLYLLGPGSTVQCIGAAMGVDKTLLGVDAVADGELAGKDLNEKQILELLGRYPHAKLVLSPVGAQGFVLGRGNLQLSAAIVRRIGRDGIVVVATPAKLARTPVLRFDTGDAALDGQLVGTGYVPVVIGYRRRRLVKAAV